MISTRFIAAIPALAIAGALTWAFAAPPKPTNIRVLTAADREVYSQAYAAADKGDWAGAA